MRISPIVSLAALALAGCAPESLDATELEAIGRGGATGSATAEVCHRGGSLFVNASAVDAHLRHGDTLPATWYADADADGWGDDRTAIDACEAPSGSVGIGGDCDDDDADTAPDADEVCGDGVDNDCDGDVDEDCFVLPSNCELHTYDGTDYAFCDGNYTRAQSVSECAAMGMDLAFVDDEAENTWLVDTGYAIFPYANYTDSYWIANRRSETGSTWASGNRIFALGEPSGDGNYVHLLRYTSQRYRWNDVPDGYRWRFICEG